MAKRVEDPQNNLSSEAMYWHYIGGQSVLEMQRRELNAITDDAFESLTHLRHISESLVVPQSDIQNQRQEVKEKNRLYDRNSEITRKLASRLKEIRPENYSGYES